MNCPFDSGERLRNVEEKASISGDVRGLSSPVCLVQFAESHFRLGGGGAGLQLYILKGLVLYSLCSGVGPVPTVLVSSIRSCPGKLASVSPYVTLIHTEKKEPLIRAIRPFFIFPFSALLDHGVSEICFQLFLA